MDIRRLLLFFAISSAIFFSWDFLVLRPLREKAQQAALQQKRQQPEPAKPKNGELEKNGKPAPPAAHQPQVAEQDLPAAQPGDQTPLVAPQPAIVPAPQQKNPQRTIRLGSFDPAAKYFLEAELTTTGAAVRSVKLTDPRYRDLLDRNQPLTLVGGKNGALQTFATRMPAVDDQLAKVAPDDSLSTVDWTVLETVVDDAARHPQGNGPVYSSATFSYVTPDGALEIRKRYSLQKSQAATLSETVRDNDPEPYRLQLTLTVLNHSAQAQPVQYTLQGPVGLPLENVENTRKFRDIKFAFLEASGKVDPETMPAGEVAKAWQEAEQKLQARDDRVTPAAIQAAMEMWKRPVAYIGVDVQYFAALVVPVDNRELANRVDDPRTDRAQPQLVKRDAANESHSDVSIVLTSREFAIPAGQELVHSYDLYAGPKRESLLAPMQATDVLDYGMFGVVAKFMLWLLNSLHGIGLPYGIAIICLTVLVRGCMFPLSKKQAAGAKKMKELQPKIAELKKKYGDDKEKMARAQMELFSEHNYNPLAGCLPVFLQLPIFIGLYTALNSAVDLRMAPFLWVDNLAAPDQLFRMPFALPFLGSDFNLLPLITVVLFVVQQKMFMPPPADEQQAQQYKMMNFMMIVMGFLFYHVPAGLCVYFIASSLWGMGERKLLDLTSSGEAEKPRISSASTPVEKNGPNAGPPEKLAKTKGLFGRLLEAAEASSAATQTHTRDSGKSDKKSGGGKSRK